MITIEEAKSLVGTEYIHVYGDGDEILAYVKAFDPEIGLTCYTLETETRRDQYSDEEADEDGTWCIYGASVTVFGLESILADLEEMSSGR